VDNGEYTGIFTTTVPFPVTSKQSEVPWLYARNSMRSLRFTDAPVTRTVGAGERGG
jgi:hypothetical protein